MHIAGAKRIPTRIPGGPHERGCPRPDELLQDIRQHTYLHASSPPDYVGNYARVGCYAISGESRACNLVGLYLSCLKGIP